MPFVIVVGQEDYDRLRPLSYPDTNVVLIAFSVDSPLSLKNVEEKWVSEVMHFCERVPLILVAMKTDLRDDPDTVRRLALAGQAPLSSEDGKKVAQRIGAYKYVECSARTGAGVNEVFECAGEASIAAFDSKKTQKKKSKKGCLIM